MRLSRFAWATGITLLSVSPTLAADQDINKYVCQKLDDFTATIVVVKADQRELSKISKDAGLLYRIKEVQVKYKEPNQIRIEGSHEGTKMVYILNGSKQVVALNGLKMTSDFGNAPGKKKSLLDVGILSEFYLSYTNAKYLRDSTVDGAPCAVFTMSYKDNPDTSHHIIYADPITKVVRKRESYSQEGKLQAIYYFKNVEQVAPGIWFPTTIEAHNIDRVVAGITTYKNIKVNQKLDDKVFKP